MKNTDIPTSAALAKLCEAYPDRFCTVTLTDCSIGGRRSKPGYYAGICIGLDVFSHSCGDPMEAAEKAIEKARTDNPTARKIKELEAAGFVITKKESATL
jgi:hypothetical protein